MNRYKNIVVAVDFSKASQQIIEKAIAVSERNQAKLHLIHTVDIILPVMDYDPSMIVYNLPIDNQEFIDASNKQLSKLKEAYQHIDMITKTLEGDASDEIINYANEIQADLIVIGSHGQSGIALLLGSTANSVLHHAKCDVLAVRVKED